MGDRLPGGVGQLRPTRALAPAVSMVLLCLIPTLLIAQTQNPERPVPLLTGSAGFFSNVNAGQAQLVPEINPLVLWPLDERWLIETRGEFHGQFERLPGGGPYGGKVEKELDYLQVDYIADRYLTITAGRFLTPFGIYNERLYPIWIRSLQRLPLIFPIGTGSSDGLMLRGGFPLKARVNLNYAAYFSTLSKVNKLESDRMAGGRIGLFLPGPRIEAGFSWQKLLQEERPNSVGFHFAWQPTPIALNLRSEYARSNKGSGYWIEAAYRLNQVPLWQTVMRRTEVVGRAQQFFTGKISSAEAEEYGLPATNARQGDLGLNYYLREGLKATASYGRQFGSGGNINLWTLGMAYRFVFPLGRMGAQ
jgi:hypothetical protein